MTTDQPIAVRLYFVKNEKDDYYKKKRQYTLRDVKTVDGINPRKVCSFLTVRKRGYVSVLSA